VTWHPLDLSSILDAVANGLDGDDAPTLIRREDGRGLFYPGEVNGIHGASGSGKTWFALHGLAQEVRARRHVFYIDHEGNPRSIVKRLLALGMTADDVDGWFHYVQPETAFQEGGDALLRLVHELQPTLVVIDSTGEGLALHGVNPNADEEVARWFQQVPRTLAALGPAVGLIDHGTKASGNELWPIGSQRKRAAITGAQFYVETLADFSREKAGALRAVCAKDRGGHFTVGETVAVLHVTPEHGGRVTLSLTAPNPEDRRSPADARADAAQRELMERIVQKIGDSEMSGARIEEGMGSRKHVRLALERLVQEGRVIRFPGARGARMHKVAQASHDLATSPAPKGRGEVARWTGPRHTSPDLAAARWRGGEVAGTDDVNHEPWPALDLGTREEAW